MSYRRREGAREKEWREDKRNEGCLAQSLKPEYDWDIKKKGLS